MTQVKLKARQVLSEGFQALVDYPLILVPFLILLAIEVIAGFTILRSISWLIDLLLTPLVVGATVKIVYDMKQGRRSSLRESTGFATERYAPLLGASILYTIIVTVGLAALLIPGVLLYIRLILYPPAVVIDNGGAWSSLTNSWGLTRGNWWKLFFISLVQSLAIIPALLLGGIGVFFINPWIYSCVTISYMQLAGGTEEENNVYL